MTGEQQQHILDLLNKKISEAELLRSFQADPSERQRLGLRLLEDAERRKDGRDVEFCLYLAFHFGLTSEYVPILCKLSDAEWHQSHENVVMALDQLRDKRGIQALARAATTLHRYLDYDASRALAVKAIWALGNLQDAGADEALRALAKSDSNIVREAAADQLRCREAG